MHADPKIMELRAKSRFLIMHADRLTKSCMYLYGKNVAILVSLEEKKFCTQLKCIAPLTQK